MKVTLVMVALVALATVGCKSTSKVMDSWVGHHYSEMQEGWGAPHRITPDGKGGKILTYEYFGSYQGNLHTKVREFYIDEDGVIYRWRWQNH